jgi:hypothetical protein
MINSLLAILGQRNEKLLKSRTVLVGLAERIVPSSDTAKLAMSFGI